jgi:tetratricopeptide (TPR) repeat protein
MGAGLGLAHSPAPATQRPTGSTCAAGMRGTGGRPKAWGRPSGTTSGRSTWIRPTRRLTQDAAPKARAAALKAISIDNGVAEAYGTLGYVEMDYYWDWESAERNFRRALEIDPGWADGHHWYGEYLVAMGRYREALAEYQKALELDPLSPIITTNLAHAFYFRREYERAAEQCRRALNLNTDFANAHADLSRALVLLGQKREAVREAETAMRLGGGAMNGLSRLGYAYARAGMEREARQTLEQLEAARTQGWNAGLGIAVVHAGLGDRTKALEWLERLTAERAPYLRTVWNDPALEEVLKQEARFTALLRSMRLPPGQDGDRPQSN